ncbi:MAG: MoaD/ThiS family protein [Pseudomonadota bacterium]
MARVLYFAQPMDRLGEESEQVPIPASGVPVRMLLAQRRGRGGDWTHRLRDGAVQVTLNRKLAGLDDTVSDGDDVGIVPARR